MSHLSFLYQPPSIGGMLFNTNKNACQLQIASAILSAIYTLAWFWYNTFRTHCMGTQNS